MQHPRWLDKSLRFAGTLLPVHYSLTDRLTPLSTASIVLADSAPEVAVRDFAELFDDHGSIGVYRVTNIRTDGSGTRTLTLQHGLCTLSDHMHPGESTDTGSCRTLLTKLLSNQTRWTLGAVDVPDDEDMTWACSNTNDQQGLLEIMDELPGYFLDFDMTASPWVLHVRAKSTEAECEARFDRNVVDVQIEYDSSDMCTVAYADGLDAPVKADTCGDWGEIVRHVSADEELGADLITETVQRYLEQNKDPRATITITALELSRLTGEPFDRFRKGMLCRCILEDRTLIQRIESIERPDVIGEPMNVILTLASTQSDLSVTVAGLVVDTRHVNQLYQQLEKHLKILAQTIEMQAETIRLKAEQLQVDGLATRVNQVVLELDAASRTLTAQAETIRLKADTTYVDNLVALCVKAAELESETLKVVESARIADLKSLNFSCSNIAQISTLYAAGGVIGSLIVGGMNVADKLSDLDSRLSALGG